MSKSVTNELKMVITSTIDELYDAVRAEKVSVADAVIVLRNQLNDIEGSIYTLNKKYLDRAFTIIGENESPSLKNKEEIKSARDLLKNYLFSSSHEDNSNESSHSDNENNELDRDAVESDVEIKENEEKKSEEEKKSSISNIIRESPRKNVSADRAVRAAIMEINDMNTLRNEILKLHQQDEVRKEQLRLLEKENEVRKQHENAELLAALNTLPKIGDKKHGKKLNKDEKRKEQKKSTSKISHSIHLNAKNTPIVSSDSDTSSSDSSSDSSSVSSSSSTTSSSSDSNRKSRRRHRSKRSKRRNDTIERHSKTFFRNVGKDGVLVYVHRIFTKAATDHAKVDLRSIREAEVIANALDAFVTGGIKVSSDGVEVLVTRLIGLIYAIQTGEWTVATAIQFTVAGTSTLPLSSSQMAKLAKRGQRIKALTTVAPKSGYQRSNSNSGTYEHNTGTGYQKYTRQNPNGSQTNAKVAVGNVQVGTGSEKSSSKTQ